MYVTVDNGRLGFYIADRSAVVGNVAGNDGGGISATAGIVAFSVDGGSSIQSNNATGNGGGVALTAKNKTTFYIVNDSTVAKNWARNNGGGIYASLVAKNASHIHVDGGSTVVNNTAVESGGGLYVVSTEVRMCERLISWPDWNRCPVPLHQT